jgi:TRAP transporter 4TM/12TM fusion protein
MVDGWLTIPLMRRIGLSPAFAGAVEAVTSTGGQIMPPVMASAAFIMAEILGVPYVKIAFAALIPALLYYITIFIILDLEAGKKNLKGLPKSQLPKFTEVIRHEGYMLLPLVILILFLVVFESSPIRAALWSTLSAIVASWMNKKTRMGMKKFLDAFGEVYLGMREVALTCASAGLIVGVLALTGLGMSLAYKILDIAGENLLLVEFIVMCITLILGMGMPTVPAYLITASVSAPILVKMGVTPLAAHMFIFYYACLSGITPPVALAIYAANSISGAGLWETGFIAVRLAIVGFIIPYMFVLNDALLMQGDPFNIIWCFLTATVGCAALAVSVQGWFMIPANLLLRVICGIAGILLIIPETKTDIAGLVLVAIAVVVVFIKVRREKTVKNTPGSYHGGKETE